MATKAIACSIILVSGVIILASSVFMFPSLIPNQPSSAFATFPGENGKIAFTSTKEDPAVNDEIAIMNAGGSGQTNLSNNPASDSQPSWSPDGKKIAFTSTRDGNYEIYVMNADGTDPTRLTNNPAFDGYPDWSPDGKNIAFTSTRDGNENVYVMNADGSGATRLTNNPVFDIQPDWSPDGTKIAFVRDFDIYVMDPYGFDQTKISSGPSGSRDPSWSPDGTKIAFTNSPGTLQYEIYVMNADGSGVANISNDPNHNDIQPSWSPDGKKIAFARELNSDSGEIRLMNADGSGKTGALADGFQPDFGPKKKPDIQITKAVDKNGIEITNGSITKSHNIQITFEGTDEVGIDRTQCSLDRQAFTSCTSPVVYDQLRKGTHQFTVRSTDAAGNIGQDQFSWTVNPPAAVGAPGRQ